MKEIAKKWGISERSVRNYCAEGRISGAVLEGKTWKIPADAEKPVRLKKGYRNLSPLWRRKRMLRQKFSPCTKIYAMIYLVWVMTSQKISSNIIRIFTLKSGKYRLGRIFAFGVDINRWWKVKNIYGKRSIL